MLRRAHPGVVGCVAVEERVKEQAPRARWGVPVLLARQVQFVLVQRSVCQRPQLVGNCFVPRIIRMKPVAGEQSSSYWVLRSGCAVEREVDRGDRNTIGLRIRQNVAVDLIQIRFDHSKDAGCRIRGDIRIVDIHGPQNRLAREAELQQFYDNCIPVGLESCNRSAQTVLVVRAAACFLHKAVLSVCKVVPPMSQVTISAPETWFRTIGSFCKALSRSPLCHPGIPRLSVVVLEPVSVLRYVA